jgi:hypothetical protein
MQNSNKTLMMAIIASMTAFLLGTSSADAQQIVPPMTIELTDTLYMEAPEGYEWADSIIYVRATPLDTAYVGRDIFDVDVRQTSELEGTMRQFLQANPSRVMSGYRVRIFFDNKQSAKVESEKMLHKFEDKYRDIPAYRTYANPYFKVTVGDCRTKSEAMALLGRIKVDFPSAFVVKENISFPVLDPEHAYDVDTVKVLRPLVLPDAVPVL